MRRKTKIDTQVKRTLEEFEASQRAAVESLCAADLPEPPYRTVGLNGHNGSHPPSPEWIKVTGKRKQVIWVRVSAIAALWEDRGSVDGPFFVQAGGRTFHPDGPSYMDLAAHLDLPST